MAMILARKVGDILIETSTPKSYQMHLSMHRAALNFVSLSLSDLPPGKTLCQCASNWTPRAEKNCQLKVWFRMLKLYVEILCVFLCCSTSCWGWFYLAKPRKLQSRQLCSKMRTTTCIGCFAYACHLVSTHRH